MTEERKKELAERYYAMCKAEKCEDCKYDYENLKDETGISHCELLYGYEQGRNDAIEEIIKSVEEIRDCGFWCMHDMCEKDEPTSYECEKCALDYIVERLKTKGETE